MTSIVLLTIVNVILGNNLLYSGEDDHPDQFTLRINQETYPFEDYGIIPDVIDKDPMEILKVPKLKAK